MLGLVLALGSAGAYGVNTIIARRGVLRSSANFVATVSILTGPVYFLIASLVSGELFNLGHFPWRAYVFFAAAGIFNFALGRTFAYRALLLVGATRYNVVTGLTVIITSVLAAIVLHEPLTPLMGLGIVLALSGPSLLALKEETAIIDVNGGALPRGKALDRPTLYQGALFGAVAAFFWGFSPIFVKLGLQNGGSPVAGALIAYVAASLAVSHSLFKPETREEFSSAGRVSFQVALASGLTSNTAQLLNVFALAYAPAAVVVLAHRTTPVWVLLLAFLFQRRSESFSRWVFLGNGLLLAGTFLAII